MVSFSDTFFFHSKHYIYIHIYICIKGSKFQPPAMSLKNDQVHCTWHFNFYATCGVLVQLFLHWFQYILTLSFFYPVYQSTLYPYFLQLSLGLLCCYFWFVSSVSMSNPYNVRQESRFNPQRVKNIEKWKVLKFYYVKKCIIAFDFFQTMSFLFVFYYSTSKVINTLFL